MDAIAEEKKIPKCSFENLFCCIQSDNFGFRL